MSNILEVRDLKINFYTESGIVKAVDGVNFSLGVGKTTAMVGESGCGKSMTALSILRLIPSPGKIEAGTVFWKGRDLLKVSHQEIVGLRGKEIGFIFQEPLTSFNPVRRVGEQIGEVLEIHTDLSKEAIKEMVCEKMSRVGFTAPMTQYNAYPHELSGGMRQRAMIAMALICGPDLLIADEPTTALDVTIQAQILDLIRELQAENQMSSLLITHNLGIVAEMADLVAVMYAGKIVEQAPVRALFRSPRHPYTQGLLASVPQLNGTETLYTIPGMIPDPFNLPAGCYFAPRCPVAKAVCKERYPEPATPGEEHTVACWLYA